MVNGSEIISIISERQDRDQFRRKNWVGTFEEYLDIVRDNPEVTRTAYQRMYDMILSYGVDVVNKGREKEHHYRFFDDPDNDGHDAVYGLRGPLHHLVNALKSAAYEYGIEKRVLLLHGPVGSSKSTIVRLLKQGLERYSETDDGALFTLGWVDEENPDEVHWCPMNEEPLHLIPERFRDDVAASLNEGAAEGDFKVRIRGELDPFCRFMYQQRLKKYDGDWTRVVQDVRVKRVILSEKDRIGIGTFQPKDEKNQDCHRTDRRHQLPQDRRLRQRQRPAGVQLRRRIQHRQPRHHRVRRSAEARRGVPVRPARRQPGTPIKPKKFAADRHRRGDHRPHQRAGVSPAAEQRVHGGAARSHGEDRHSVRHDARARESRSTRRTTTAERCRTSTSPRTRSKWRRCGRFSRGWKSRSTPA